MPHRRMDIIDRIVANIILDDNNCWIWQGSTSGKAKVGKTGRGYGKISISGISSMVHRVMYVCHHGYIPNKMHVDHTCRKRLCCNPEHLEAVTGKVNNDRKIERSNEKLTTVNMGRKQA